MNCSYIVLKEPVWPVDLLGGGSGLFPFGAPPSDPKCTRPRKNDERKGFGRAPRISIPAIRTSPIFDCDRHDQEDNRRVDYERS